MEALLRGELKLQTMGKEKIVYFQEIWVKKETKIKNSEGRRDTCTCLRKFFLLRMQGMIF